MSGVELKKEEMMGNEIVAWTVEDADVWKSLKTSALKE